MTFGQLRFRLSKLAPGIDPDKLDGFINDAYESILNRRQWKGLEADGRFQTLAPYETGTLSLTAGALDFTGNGTTFTEDMNQMGVYVQGRNESYRFNFTDPTHGALDRPYEGGTSATAGYKLYQDIYELPDDYKSPMGARNERVSGLIEHVDRRALDFSAPARLIFGEPRYYTQVTPGPNPELNADEENDRKRAQLYPIPGYAAGYPYSYIRSVPRLTEGDTSVPILPWVSEVALINFTRAMIEADKENYGGAEVYTALANAEINKMLLEDAKNRGPQKLRMAAQFTRHRLERSQRYGSGGPHRP